MFALSSLTLVAPPAAAHDELISASPAAGESVESIPAEVRLVFSGVLSPEAGATAVDVVDGAGTSLADGDPVVEENTVTQALDAASDASGEIRVLWRVVSSDGHPISGEYTFTVTAPPAPSPTETATTEPTTPPATAEPTETPVPDDPDTDADESATFLAWLIPLVLGLLVIAGVVYLIASSPRRRRARREKAAADASAAASGSPSSADADPRSDHPADH